MRGGSRRGRRVAVLIWASLVLVGVCGRTEDGSETTGPTTTAPPATAAPSSPTPRLGSVDVELVEVATLQQPLAMAVRREDPALYVAEKTGRFVRVLGDGGVDPVAVLDLSGEVSLGSEQGLLGLVFSPSGRYLFVNYTDTNGDTHVTSFLMRGNRADPATRRDVLVVDQPYANHNGGNLAFGPDGYLYVGLGDGGSGGDPHGNGRSLGTLLGKMLRIDPMVAGPRPYSIPPGNPFVDRSDAQPEIWAYGLRDPWRYSFDRATGDLWIADVGQTEWEEIDLQPAGSDGGENYGWNLMEGDHAFEGGASPDGVVRPVFEYPHDAGGCTVVGGYVYRGTSIPGLDGAYLFGDFCLGELEALRIEGGRAAEHRVLGPVIPNLNSFGEDARGELYAMSLDGGLYRIVAGS